VSDIVKRVLDVIFSFWILLIASPLFVVVSIAIWLDTGFPIFFRQERVGVGFNRFHILKFRTMLANESGPRVTVRGDTRVTRIGAILRLMKIDELPQFWNVLRGQMSIVGPRPEVPEYVELFKTRYENVLRVRPGITDFASIVFRDEEALLSRSKEPLREYKEHILPAKLDLADRYIREQNLFLDLVIIMRTAVAALRPGT
jgi:lipopolysaccharide/colanic/teichoic acid biosynthesis glycosyltransferase